MAYTNPRTWADETIVNADDLNTEIRDNVSALYSMANAPYRNLLYNGAMQIAQRSTSIPSITTGGYYTADRWYTNIGSAGTWTQSVVAEAPTASGFQKSLKMLCTTASASLAAGANLDVYQALEGQDLIRVMKGSANAKTLTLSFWVRSNVTGTYVAWLADMNNTRSVGATYTVSASGVWELKTITFPADATGALNNDNGASLRVRFHLVAGSTYTSGTLNTTWASTVNANTAPGQTNLAAATSNYWQVTGAQLETGPIATPFEFLPFGDELARCQRYYEKSYDTDVAPGTVTDAGAFIVYGSSDASQALGYTVPLAVAKRTSGYTVTPYRRGGSNLDWSYSRNGANGNVAPVITFRGHKSFLGYIVIGSAWVVSTLVGHWTVDAEL